MVDVDDIFGGGDKKSSSSSSSSSSSNSSSSSSSGSGSETTADAFSMDDEAMMDPDESSINKQSEVMANNGELNYEGKESGYGAYKKRQIKEVKELHDDIKETAKDNGDTIPEFTVVMHAALMNLAQNRVGIANVIRNEYGKTKSQSRREANEICQRAGEKEMFEEMTQYLTKKLMQT